MLRGYEWASTSCCAGASQRCACFSPPSHSGYLFVVIPKGFFPQQDVGLITGITEGGQDISFKEMSRLQSEIGTIIQKDPAVASIAMAIGGGGNALNNGRMFITLKPRDNRDVSAQQIIARLRPQFESWKAAACSCKLRRMSASADAPRVRSSNIPCRMPISTN
jgi:HAE1 family hydrophobic/amphiphilic exporter-1